MLEPEPIAAPAEMPREPPRRVPAGYGPRPRARGTALYSRFVGTMKIVLPVVAAGLIALVAVWPHLEPADSTFRIGYTKLSLTEAGDPSAVNPRILGTDKHSQIYSVTADLARNLVQDAATIELEMPKADLTLEDGSWVVVTADAGVIDRSTETLELTGDVTVYHDAGYEFTTSRAMVHLSDRLVVGDQPVKGSGPFGNVEAEGFQVIDMGEAVFFTGRSRVILYPNAGTTVE